MCSKKFGCGLQGSSRQDGPKVTNEELAASSCYLFSGIMDSNQNSLSPLKGVRFLDSWSEPDHLISVKDDLLDGSLRDLLTYRGSLTQRLEDLIGKRVELQLISHFSLSQWPEDPKFWNNEEILAKNNCILVRNAWLVLGGERYVFAHSQIVLNDLSESDRVTITAGNQALGYLFMEKNGQLKRENLQFNRISFTNSDLFPGFCGFNPCWCRRSQFYVDNVLRARILEIFPDKKEKLS